MSEIDHEWTDNIVCPYCGYEDHDSWEISDNDGSTYCGDCGKEFMFERHTSINYSSEKADCLNEMAEHQWKQMIGAPAHYFKDKERCQVCLTERTKPKTPDQQ